MPIHAYDQVETLLGQGTVGLEIEVDTPGIDTLLVAVGGGGLIGGIAAWFASRIRIVAVEPEGAPTLNLALAAGRPVDAPAEGIAADSLAPKQVGRLMFPIAQQHVQRSVLVSDDAIRVGAKGAVGACARRRRAGRCGGLRRAPVGRLRAVTRRTRRRARVRRQYDRREV